MSFLSYNATECQSKSNANSEWQLSMKIPDFDFIFTDYDIYLFNQGNLFELYKKMGSHPSINRNRRGVHFAVWAPNASTVSVAGTFNDWTEHAHPMICRRSCGIWELFIPEVAPGAMYKYYIRTREGYLLEKADPYSQLNEYRPFNASIVFESSYRWKDNEYLLHRQREDSQIKPVSIYEVHAGSWRRHEDGSWLSYRELADVLPAYALECGFTHIEFLPLMEHPFDGSWGYQVTGFFSSTSRFGTPDDLRFLVDACHENNIGVIFDWVPAHFPADAFGLARFDGTALYEYADAAKGYHPEWNTYIFDYTKENVRNFLISSALFWIDEFHADGIRVDAVASMVYLDYARNSYTPNIYGGKENLEAVFFLQSLSSEIMLRHPGLIYTAEESTAWPNVTGEAKTGTMALGFTYKWNMGWMHDFLEYMTIPPDQKKDHHNKLVFSMDYAYNEKFILPLSHDEVVHCKRSLVNKMPGNDKEQFSALRASYTFMFTHPGKKLLFMGGELAQKKEWNHDAQIDWDLLNEEPHIRLHTFFKELNGLYRSKPALFDNDFAKSGFQWLQRDAADTSVLAFLRRARDPEKVLLVVINFRPEHYEGYRIGVPVKALWKELFNSNAKIFGGNDEGNRGGFDCEPIPAHTMDYSLPLTIPPYSALIFEPQR